MFNLTDDLITKAKQIIGSNPVKAAGYRIKIFLLEAEEGLDAGQAAVAPTLAALGFKAKTDTQKEREDRGSDMAIVVSVGEGAYTAPHLAGVKWCKPGDVIRILRYAGHQFEDPPGSGRRYGLINDEDVLGVYEHNVMEASNG